MTIRALVRRGDQHRGHWLSFTAPVGIIHADCPADVPAALADAERAAANGAWAVGFVTYEAAPAFDRALCVHAPRAGPLVWFALFNEPRRFDRLPAPEASCPDIGPWKADLSDGDFRTRVTRIRDYIAAGDIYQANLTCRFTCPFAADAYSLFHRLWERQPVGHAAFLTTDAGAILSLSPELFFELDGTALSMRPMKGTAARGRWRLEDLEAAARLARSPKDRAENAMIADMVRNDCGRIATPGSVVTERAFAVERYRTVWQMTTTVTARTAAPVPELFGALFPCASVTGAPKVRSMQIIRDLEASPRGVYCGAVGFLAPGRRASFNVAIRTLYADGAQASYGAGAGIVWDSRPDLELAETRAKMAILADADTPFELLETLLWRPQAGYRLLSGHMHRLRQSAAHFDFSFDASHIVVRLLEVAAAFPAAPQRVRLLLARNGAIRIEHAAFAVDRARPVRRLALAGEPVNPADTFLYHKTTRRALYDRLRASAPSAADDVLLYNTRGEVTETSIANIIVRIGGQWLTPAIDCGVLPGVMRTRLATHRQVREASIRVADLPHADAIMVFNSVRGFSPAILMQ